MPVANAASGLKTAKSGPRRLKVTKILSIPVWGVDLLVTKRAGNRGIKIVGPW